MTDGVAFDIDGGLLLALVRAISVATLFSVFGGLVFLTIVAPRALVRMGAGAPQVEAGLRRVVLASVAANLVATVAWLVLQSADLADAETLSGALTAVPTVLSRTVYGHLVAFQLLGVAGVAPLVRLGRWPALALSAVVVTLQAGHSHAAAMDQRPSLLLAADMVHLLSGGAWLGGLLPLLLMVWWAPPAGGATAARWFSPMGQVCVAGMVVSAGYQGWVLVASLEGLFDTAYGWVVLGKTALFGVLLFFAVANRFRFAPALAHSGTKRMLIGSIALQTAFGLAVVSAAAVLSSLAPPMKM